MKHSIVVRLLLWLIPLLLCAAPAVQSADLRVSPNKHYLLKDSQPFFWLGDTPWWIMRLTDEQIREYLSNRARKGFTGIQVDLNPHAWTNFVSAEEVGNPFLDNNIDTPNDAYWRRVDWMLDEASRHGLCVLLTPMWGKFFPRYVGDDPAKAHRLGKWLGNRFRDRGHVMWFVSGEYDSINNHRPITPKQKALFNAVARGLKAGHGGKQLMTIHPGAIRDSSVDFQNETWLDFNMLQSGHFADSTKWNFPENYMLIANDRQRTPTKPVFDGEPAYEDMIDGYYVTNPKGGSGVRMGADVMRRKAYWAVLAGAFGHTYGHSDVQIFWTPDKPVEAANRNHWRDALEAPGAGQMRQLRSLLESRPWHTLEPDQSIVVAGQGSGEDHIQSARASDGKFLFVYIPRGNKLTLDMTKVKGSQATAHWFNPRDGQSVKIGQFPCSGTHEFSPPTQGVDQDWVLVLDDTTQDFPIPGATRSVATGPLRKHPTNGRYFTDGTKNPDGSLRAVYLTGTHTWANLQDCGIGVGTPLSITDPPAAFDYDGYLNLLQTNNHNFIRLWRWELPKTVLTRAGVPITWFAQPHPWVRSGPGTANDGKPKFDLYQFDQSYFDRLRARVLAARDRGIYVGIMLFEGWWLGPPKDSAPDSWQYHPFHRGNNVNEINGDANGDGKGDEITTLRVPAVLNLQKAYVRKVIDTVNGLDNVLYEIANETQVSGSIQWQYDLITYIKSYQAGKPKQHPVGMTWSWEGLAKADSNPDLLNSQADWISLGHNWHTKNYDFNNPPATDGKKVNLADTDHYGYDKFRDDPAYSRAWVWKTFLRGHNPILMEDLLNKSGWIANRAAMGHTLTYANKMNLAAMTPQNGLSTTSYCLANSGQEYLVYQPGTGAFLVDLIAGSYAFEWFNPTTGIVMSTGSVTAAGGNESFPPPFAGSAVLSLRLIKK